MRSLNIKYVSDVLSVLIHVIIFALFMNNFHFIKERTEEVIEIGLEPGGGSGGASPAAPSSVSSDNSEKSFITTPREKLPSKDTRDVPVRQNNQKPSEEVIRSSKESKQNKQAEVASSAVKGENRTGVTGRGGEGTNPYGTGIGNGWGYGSGNGNGNGNGQGNGVGDGYSINFGGSIRKIYSYTIPKYPDGVNKQADIRIRFSIMPDGSVSNIIVLTKADRRLEMAAVNSLRRWRFAPLGAGQKQAEQTATIVFPFRLD
ncbi:MAG: TonB family protein [Bacteroidota bacterium]